MTVDPPDLIDGEVPRSRVRLLDVAVQAGAAIVERPSRTIASLLTVVLGISAGVATLCIAATASHQVSGRFDARRATEVVLRPSDEVALDPAKMGEPFQFPADAEQRLDELNGLRSAGVILAHERSVTIATNHLDDPLRRNQTVEPVYGVSPGLRDAARAEVDGRWLDRWEQESGAKVVVLGRAVARKLEISRPGRLVYLDGVPFWVAGILLSSEAAPQLTAGIVVSDRASQAFGEPSNESYMLLRTAPGAAQVIARQAPIQVLPEGPGDLAASAPPDPRTLRTEVESDTARTVISMALVSVLIGAISIANSALTGIYQRTHEIGLRRALGATPRHVLAQTLIETTVLGLVAGLAGSLIGTIATLAVAVNAGWTPVIDPRVPLAAPLLGALVGAVAGVYPALRAARIEPSTALRSQ
jgi:ABC-type lipoprotein release transport system permease subunit